MGLQRSTHCGNLCIEQLVEFGFLLLRQWRFCFGQRIAQSDESIRWGRRCCRSAVRSGAACGRCRWGQEASRVSKSTEVHILCVCGNAEYEESSKAQESIHSLLQRHQKREVRDSVSDRPAP